MKLEDFSTLAEAQAYTETTTDFISKSTMSLYLRATGLYLHFYKVANGELDTDGSDHPAKETAFMVVKALESGNADGKDFNFITGHPFGNANQTEVDNLINATMTDKAPELTALKNLCVAHCNKTSQPYASATQEEFDEAKAAANKADVEVSYPSETFIITLANQGVDVNATADIDGDYPVYMEVCVDSANQNSADSYRRYAQPVGFLPVRNGKGFLSLSSRKVRTYNRLFVNARTDANVVANVVTNRG